MKGEYTWMGRKRNLFQSWSTASLPTFQEKIKRKSPKRETQKTYQYASQYENLVYYHQNII